MSVEAAYSSWLLQLDRSQLEDHVDYLADELAKHQHDEDDRQRRFYAASLDQAMAAGTLREMLADIEQAVAGIPDLDPKVFSGALLELARLSRHLGTVSEHDLKDIFIGALEVAFRRGVTDTTTSEGT